MTSTPPGPLASAPAPAAPAASFRPLRVLGLSAAVGGGLVLLLAGIALASMAVTGGPVTSDAAFLE